jgi:hypothetical protein
MEDTKFPVESRRILTEEAAIAHIEPAGSMVWVVASS